MDPLSDVLSLLRLRSYSFGGFDAGGAWSIAFGQHEGIKIYAVVSGECWLSMDGMPEPKLIKAGDCFLLPRGRAFRVASDLTTAPVDVFTVFSGAKDGSIVSYNGGGDFFSVGGYFALSGDYAAVLLGSLPPVVHICNETDKAALRWGVERMRQELREPQPGGFLIAQQLATMILIQAMRLHLADGSHGSVGWLFALSDPQMAAAINAIHDHPAGRWTLQSLATRAGMSRTTFTVKFKETVGVSPIEYLTRWRMMMAGDRLVKSSGSVSAIAFSLGYESESAFSAAFKRVMGCSPKQYGKQQISAPAESLAS